MGRGESLQIFPLKTQRGLVQISFLGIPARPGATRPLFDLLERHGVPLKFLIEGFTDSASRDLVICISGEAIARLELELNEVKTRMQSRDMVIQQPVAVVRMLGPHFDIRPGTSGLLFSALAQARIPVYSNATTATSSLCVIPDDQAEAAERAISRVFEIPRGKK